LALDVVDPNNLHVSGGTRALFRLSGILAVALAGVVWLILLGPLGSLLSHLSVGSISRAIRAPGALGPLVTSLEASAVALLALVLLGTPLAWMLARGRMPFAGLFQVGLLVPLLMPPLVIGLLLIFLVGPLTPIGNFLAHFHMSASDTFLALVLAEFYESAPYFVLGAEAAFAGVGTELEDHAQLLGDSRFTSFRRITLPLAAPGLATSLAVGWARAMGAFGAVLVIAYHPYGLPMQIWVTLEEKGLAAALPFALVLLIASLPVPLLAYLWAARARRWNQSLVIPA
jgi:molybdate/tungstate transport system permease protein